MSSARSIKTLGLAGLMAVMAMMVVAAAGAATASAKPYWTENGVELKAGEKRAITSENEAGTVHKLIVPGVATIVCETVTDEGEIIGGEPGTDKETIKFTKCKVEGAPNCTVKGGGGGAEEIIVKVNTTLGFWPNGLKNRVVDYFEPESGTNFVTIKITGENCALKGEFKVEGSVIGEITPVGVAKPSLTITFRCSTTGVQEPTEYETAEGVKKEDTLTFAGKPACLEGKDLFKLTNGQEIDVHV